MLARRKVNLLLLACAASAAALMTPGDPEALETAAPERFIVQATDLAGAREAVEQVGGQTTHELAVIRAVGAALSRAQRDRLEGIDGLRVYPDRELRTDGASCNVLGAEILDHSGDKIKWELTNLGADTLRIKSITLYWPADFGSLREIKFAGKIFEGSLAPSSAELKSGWAGDRDDRDLEPNKARRLELKFSDKGASADGVMIRVAFKGGCSAEYGLCRVTGGDQLVFDGKWVRWPLSNLGSSRVTLDGLALRWPLAAGNLKKIKLHGSNVFDEGLTGGSAAIRGGWHSNQSARAIGQHWVADLELEFEARVPTDPHAYRLTADFAEGCSAGYTPAAGTPAPPPPPRRNSPSRGVHSRGPLRCNSTARRPSGMSPTTAPTPDRSRP